MGSRLCRVCVRSLLRCESGRAYGMRPRIFERSLCERAAGDDRSSDVARADVLQFGTKAFHVLDADGSGEVLALPNPEKRRLAFSGGDFDCQIRLDRTSGIFRRIALVPEDALRLHAKARELACDCVTDLKLESCGLVHHGNVTFRSGNDV